MYVGKFADIFVKNVINASLENARGIFQTEGHSNEMEFSMIYRECRFFSLLRDFLYGIANLTIYTDHQSLIYSISGKNPNTEQKRWMNFIAEFGAEIKYKPGSQNVLADARSRHQISYTSDNSPDEQIKRSSF